MQPLQQIEQVLPTKQSGTVSPPPQELPSVPPTFIRPIPSRSPPLNGTPFPRHKWPLNKQACIPLYRQPSRNYKPSSNNYKPKLEQTTPRFSTPRHSCFRI